MKKRRLRDQGTKKGRIHTGKNRNHIDWLSLFSMFRMGFRGFRYSITLVSFIRMFVDFSNSLYLSLCICCCCCWCCYSLNRSFHHDLNPSNRYLLLYKQTFWMNWSGIHIFAWFDNKMTCGHSIPFSLSLSFSLSWARNSKNDIMKFSVAIYCVKLGNFIPDVKKIHVRNITGKNQFCCISIVFIN